MLLLPDAWTWDFWLADDGADEGERFHAFYLRASRALLDPERRHRRASVGHAVSADLRSWRVVADALVPADGPAFDDLAVWTGSVVRRPGGGWRMFFTGVSRADDVRVQRIGAADSADLVTWTRAPSPAGFEADGRWYEKRGPDNDEAWRDPWVFADPRGAAEHGWHMLVTARAPGPAGESAVVGHATSPDLVSWQAGPPLSAPGAGFGHLEVMQLAVVEGRAVLVFSCFGTDLGAARRAAGDPGGVWALPVDSPLGPFDLSRARPLGGPDLYAGRITHDRAGRAVLLAFRAHDGRGAFVGGISDPLPLAWSTGPEPRLTVVQR